MTTTQAPRPSQHKGFRLRSCYYTFGPPNRFLALHRPVTSTNPQPITLVCLRTAELGLVVKKISHEQSRRNAARRRRRVAGRHVLAGALGGLKRTRLHSSHRQITEYD